MKATAFFLVVLMAAILLLRGEYKQIMTHFAKENNNNINIFYYWTYFGVRTTIFYTNGPRCAIAHGSSTVYLVTYSRAKVDCSLHFKSNIK